MTSLLLLIWTMSAARAAEAKDFQVQMWDTEDGLSDSTVTSIAQTPDGYLWVGTKNGGLARFDGQRFVIFNPGNTPELRAVEIRKVLVDAQGTLWIGMVDGAVTSYCSGQFRFEFQGTGNPPAMLESVLLATTHSTVLAAGRGYLFEGTTAGGTNHWTTQSPPADVGAQPACRDRQGTIWYRTQDQKLVQVRSNQFVCLPEPPGLRGRHINVVLTDAADWLWVGTEKEIARWDGGKFVNQTPTNGASDVAVRQIVACPDGSLWVRSGNQLRKCRERQWVAEVTDWAGSEPQFPCKLNSDSRGGVWVSSSGAGLWHVAADGEVTRVRAAEGLLNLQFECWFEDREGNVWIGLRAGGLVCVRARTFHPVWLATEPQLAIRSICEDSSGAMWFGTSGNRLLRWRHGEFTSFTPPADKLAGSDSIAFPAAAGSIWGGGVLNGVFRLENEQFTRPFPADAIRRVVRVLYEDRANRLWIGSEYGLFCWESGQLKPFTVADGFNPAHVQSISEDKSGSLWIGTANGQLRRYRDGNFTTYIPKDHRERGSRTSAAAGSGSLVDFTKVDRFWALHADDQGVIWIGSLGGGLLRFQDGGFTRYTSRAGLPSDQVNQIQEDEQGQLWLGTQNGIIRVSKAQLNAFAQDGTNPVQFFTYGKSDGLLTTECSSGSQPACWRSRDGKLWFTTVKGAVWTDPAAVPFNNLVPPVLIEEVAVDGKRAGEHGQPVQIIASPAPSQLTVPPGRHYFDFKFTATSFTAPNQVMFQWRLAGLEKNWNPASHQRSVRYGFLPPGNYKFQVKACNNDGVWNETGAAISLTVQPYLWQTWWFPFGVTLLLMAGTGGVVALVLRVQHRRRLARLEVLRAAEQERSRISRDLHDDVGANLANISLLAQVMERQPSREDATEIRGLAVETMDTLRDIVWFIDPHHERLSDLVARLNDIAQKTLRHLNCQFEKTGDFDSATLPLAFRRNVPPIFKEALHNILKHARATKVRISVRREGSRFQFQISDDGVGFDEPTVSVGHGLKNMRHRVADIGGQVEIASQPGKGTVITLTAPIP